MADPDSAIQAQPLGALMSTMALDKVLSVDQWIKKSYELKQERKCFALVTIIGFAGSSPREVGAKMLVEECGKITGSIGGGLLEKQIIECTVQQLRHPLQATTEVKKIQLCERTGQCCGGTIEILIEYIGVRPQLFILGAGHVGQAICQVLDQTAFAVTIVDERIEWLENGSLPEGIQKALQSPLEFVQKQESLFWENHYAVVMTHDHALDYQLIVELCQQPLRYLGLIGSGTKWARFSSRLRRDFISDELIDQVECPIGDFQLGKAPKEIAISLASRLLKLHHLAYQSRKTQIQDSRMAMPKPVSP